MCFVCPGILTSQSNEICGMQGVYNICWSEYCIMKVAVGAKDANVKMGPVVLSLFVILINTPRI